MPDSANNSGNVPPPCREGWTCSSTMQGRASIRNSPIKTPAAIRLIIELNLMALLDLTQKAANYMRQRDSGQILQISSVLGFVGIPYSAVYAASKHAVNGLVKSLRYELRGTGVRVWAACPGRTAERVLGNGSGGGRRSGPASPGRAHGPCRSDDPARSQAVAGVSRPHLDGLGRAAARSLGSSRFRLAHRSLGEPSRGVCPPACTTVAEAAGCGPVSRPRSRGAERDCGSNIRE